MACAPRCPTSGIGTVGRKQRWYECSRLLAVVVVARSAVAFVPTCMPSSTSNFIAYRSRALRHHGVRIRYRARLASARAVSPMRAGASGAAKEPSSANTDGENDDGKELWGLKEFYAQKAERDRENGDVPKAAAEFLKRAVVGDVAALRAALQAEKDRLKAEATSGNSDEIEDVTEIAVGKEEREKVIEVEGLAAAVAAVAAAGGAVAPRGLGLEGGIFPSDVSQSLVDKDITLQGAKLDSGQPDAMVGFWQVYGATGNREDVSGRIILRADGQVVGGPAVRKTPEVKWSDEEGLKPVGGRWEVYTDEQTGRARLRFSLTLSFQKKQQLEMDGTVMMVDGWDEILGRSEVQAQVFGAVQKRTGEKMMAGKPGDFSMMKTVRGEGDVLVATVGSQSQRMW